MTTTPIPLTNTAWVDLGATPLVVCTIDDRNPAVLVVADAAPTSITAQGLVVSSKNVDGQVINGNGQHVYARALNHLTTVIALPYSGGGSGAGGSSLTFTPTQTDVAVPAYNASDTSGSGGTNGTVVLAATGVASTLFMSIDNTGSADAEVWFGAKPASAKVGQTPKKGKPLPAGAGLFFDARVPIGPVYVTAQSATGLSVVTG